MLKVDDFTHSFESKLKMDIKKTELTRHLVEPLIKGKNVIDWGCGFGPRTYHLKDYEPETIRCWDPNFWFKEVFQRFVASNQITWIDNPEEEQWCDVLYIAAVHNEVGPDPYTWFDNLLDHIHCKNVITTWGLAYSWAEKQWATESEMFWYPSFQGHNFEDGKDVFSSSKKASVVEHFIGEWRPGSLFNTMILERV